MEFSQFHGLAADDGQAYNLMAQMLATQLGVREAVGGRVVGGREIGVDRAGNDA